MKATYFRFKYDERPVWYGLAVYKNKFDLFKTIDEYGNPFDCELKPVSRRDSICFKIKRYKDRTGDECWKFLDQETEHGDGIYDAITDEEGWVDAGFTLKHFWSQQ